MPQGNTVKVTVQPQRLIDTAPQGQLNNPKNPQNQRNNLISTDKIAMNKTPDANGFESAKLERQSSKGLLTISNSSLILI